MQKYFEKLNINLAQRCTQRCKSFPEKFHNYTHCITCVSDETSYKIEAWLHLFSDRLVTWILHNSCLHRMWKPKFYRQKNDILLLFLQFRDLSLTSLCLISFPWTWRRVPSFLSKAKGIAEWCSNTLLVADFKTRLAPEQVNTRQSIVIGIWE